LGVITSVVVLALLAALFDDLALALVFGLLVTGAILAPPLVAVPPLAAWATWPLTASRVLAKAGAARAIVAANAAPPAKRVTIRRFACDKSYPFSFLGLRG